MPKATTRTRRKSVARATGPAVTVKAGRPRQANGLTEITVNTKTLGRFYEFTVTPKNGRPILLAIHL